MEYAELFFFVLWQVTDADKVSAMDRDSSPQAKKRH
jgi:hypothetical protein